jgi:two-component system OmpR family response regulator
MPLNKVFIIDDEKDLGQLLKNYFVKKHYEVEVYHLLHEGLQALEKHQAGIVFLDNNLPDGLGWEKINELHERFPDVRLHLLSGYNYTKIPMPKEAKIKVWQKPLSYSDLDSYFN